MPTSPRTKSGRPPVRASHNAQDLADRRIKAVEMRIQGMTYNAIAEALKVGYHTVWNDIKVTLQEREAEAVPQLRQIEEERLNHVVAEANAIAKKYRNTKPELALKALDRVIRAVQTRAALLGLNAPVEVNVVQHTQLDAEIADLLRQQQALNEGTRAAILDGEARDVHDIDIASLPSPAVE